MICLSSRGRRPFGIISPKETTASQSRTNVETTYAYLTDPSLSEEIAEMMHQLYREDHSTTPPASRNFQRTIDQLLTHPHAGKIVLFLRNNTPVGYALLIPYWSNEFGGTILFIDELFVSPNHRSQGIARGLFAWLHHHRPFNSLALLLEVSPTNTRAKKLYHSLGFADRTNSIMSKQIT
jgi:ribosomal protein S18 acetylase RimI-like enzyme